MYNMKNLDLYINHILNDYKAFMNPDNRTGEVAKQVALEMIDQFQVEVVKGSKYLKIVTSKKNGNQRSVHSFICIRDMGKFTSGDILKPASWAAPAKNFARGNLFQGDFSKIRWMGA